MIEYWDGLEQESAMMKSLKEVAETLKVREEKVKDGELSLYKKKLALTYYFKDQGRKLKAEFKEKVYFLSLAREQWLREKGDKMNQYRNEFVQFQYTLEKLIVKFHEKADEYGDILLGLADCRSIEQLDRYRQYVDKEKIAKAQYELDADKMLSKRGCNSYIDLVQQAEKTGKLDGLIEFKWELPQKYEEAQWDRKEAYDGLQKTLSSPAQLPKSMKRKVSNKKKYTFW